MKAHVVHTHASVIVISGRAGVANVQMELSPGCMQVLMAMYTRPHYSVGGFKYRRHIYIYTYNCCAMRYVVLHNAWESCGLNCILQNCNAS